MKSDLTLTDIAFLKSLIMSEYYSNPVGGEFLLDLADKINFLRSQEMHKIEYNAKVETSK